jgi:predicted O-methyltransferase YrrM
MKFKHYEEWFRRILKFIPDKSVIVIDRAPYHTVQDPATRNPTSSSKKDDIFNWLIDHKIEPAVDSDG